MSLGSIFGGDEPTAPTPAPVPVSPSAPDNLAAEKARQDAENQAIADQKAAGRKSTIVAGMKIAADEQMGRGLLAQKKRAAADDLMA
jgi:hypothetical protein